MRDARDWNSHNLEVIEEFRRDGGRRSGSSDELALVLVHHRGRRSGLERVNPVVAQELDSGWAVFASFAGGPRHPDWYLNLMAEPRTTIEVGAEEVEVRARAASGAERTEIWERQKTLSPVFAEYEVTAGDRVIPVVMLEPIRD